MIKETFQNVMNERKETVDVFLSGYLSELHLQKFSALVDLKKSVEYSLIQSGKRFRPVLALMLAEEFGVGPKQILPFTAAVEMIHTYSLVHDDLPCMDNDDYRRGQPTNHKVFGESVALLAGDALLTEAFMILSKAYSQTPNIAVQLIQLLSEASGIRGMVGGQAIDMKAKGLLPNVKELGQMHAMKTGALIRVSCEGVGAICSLPEEKIKLCKEFGEQLGFAFQLADDILDSSEGKIEKGSFPDLVGISETQNLLKEISANAKKTLNKLGIQVGNLFDLVEYNSQRNK